VGVSCVFAELDAGGDKGSYPNRKKIAVTKSDGTTECYVEIEEWDGDSDSGNEKAWLWVKVPSVRSSADTELYLFYDKDQDDHDTTYVEDSGSRPEVWDDHYAGVWHLSETPDADGGTDEILDSTNDNDGDTFNMASNDQDSGQIDGSLDFDGSNDYVEIPRDASLEVDVITISAWVYVRGTPGNNANWRIITKQEALTQTYADWALNVGDYQPSNRKFSVCIKMVVGMLVHRTLRCHLIHGSM